MAMTTDTPSRNRKYPWELWMDGRRHAVPLEQLPVSVESFRSTARAAARTRGLAVTVLLAEVDGVGPCVTIEAFDPDVEPDTDLGDFPDVPLSAS